MRIFSRAPIKSLFKFSFFLLALAALLLLGANPALAQEPTPDTSQVTDDQVNAIAKQMYCPVCESTPLDVCPTQACAQWRELIRLKIAEGWSEKQIKDYFVEQYGARVLAAPPARGFNVTVYVLPPLAILAGVFVLYRVLKAWRRSTQPSPVTSQAEPKAGDDEYIRRVEEELRKR